MTVSFLKEEIRTQRQNIWRENDVKIEGEESHLQANESLKLPESKRGA